MNVKYVSLVVSSIKDINLHIAECEVECRVYARRGGWRDRERGHCIGTSHSGIGACFGMHARVIRSSDP
jgi:hypothetical protein